MPDEESPGRKNRPFGPVALTLHIREEAWIEAIPELERLVRAALGAAVVQEAPAREQASGGEPSSVASEIAVVLADDAFVRTLNARFRAKDRSTNVLSFPAPACAGELGDIVLAFQTVAAEARAERKSLAEHTAHLLVHGALHLLGHTHEDDGDTARMTVAEIAALRRLGFSNPYRQRLEEGAS